MNFQKDNETGADGLNMTPMIDIVFQLIIFFMLSLRLYSAEGDFSIKMPSTAPQEGLPDNMQMPPVKVRLRADEKGDLAGITMGRRRLSNFLELRNQIREIAGMDRGPTGASGSAEVELDCDYNLKYKYVINVLTAISGYLAEDKQTVVRLIEKIRFSPPRKQVK